MQIVFRKNLDSDRIKPSEAGEYLDNPIPRSVVGVAIVAGARYKYGHVRGFEHLAMTSDESSCGALPPTMT
jgi:hypothetical protein